MIGKERVSLPRDRQVAHLNRYYHFTELMRDPTIESHLIRYQSDYDKTVQTVLIMQPANRVSKSLFFFFHGMDGDSGDGVVVQDVVKRLEATVVAPGGRGASWLSDAFLADAGQVISQYSPGFNGYYVMGVSMGGTQVLALPGLLPARLRQSISGVIALVPGSDLRSIMENSSNGRVRDTLKDSVNGSMTKLQQRSPIRLIDCYKDNLPFAIFHNEDDTILLTRELERFFFALRHADHPLAVFSAPGDHDFTYKHFDYVKVAQELGNNLVRKGGAPLWRQDS
jgi:dipeptidyl aminopeptidase/acylaminoacyl peptidase